ncbi:MAG: HD domain-containing protein [Eubacteriales bacterium]|nr:HD domain-containing protein [Eubacteriales bacterium]
MPSEPIRNEILSDFSARADAFVASVMAGYTPQHIRRSKVIHDCVWGTVMLCPWELQILDSPLLQRLRRINQLGLAMTTYPSAHHSRFEHTLGVLSVTTKMISRINQDESADVLPPDASFGDGSGGIPPRDVRLLRLAALLHDVGHCFFSHLSESYYGRTPEMTTLKREDPVFSNAQPHEIFGYIIINTPSFRRFFAEGTDFPLEGEDAGELLDTVGRMIVGAPVPPRRTENGWLQPSYLTEMINGRFDADSLDYLRRDTYATGLALTYHIDRVLYKLCLADCETVNEAGERVTERHLTVPVSGISTVEEMVFSKLMLTRYIYQHQKVIAVESLVGDVVEGMRYNGRLLHPCDFLYFCDADILSLGMTGDDPAFRLPAASFRLSPETKLTTGRVIQRILERDLPKKALLINRGVLRGRDGSASKEELAGTVERLLAMQDLREAVTDEAIRIARKLGIPEPEIYDIHISVPKIKMSKNFDGATVLTYDGGFASMSDIVDLNDWAGDFAADSYNAYVFAGTEHLVPVSLAAYRVLSERGIPLDRAKVFAGLKASAEIEAASEKL